MSDILERVEKLIALSASNNENEARNAAWIAVKLIREHKLTVQAPSSVRQPRTFEDLFRDWGTPRDWASPPRRPPPPRKGQGSRKQPPPPEEPGRYVADLSEEELAEMFKEP